MEHLLGLASECRCYILKQEVQYTCEYTALHARKWSGFICKRASEDMTRSAEDRRRRMPNLDFFLLRTVRGYVKLRYIAMLYTPSIRNQP